MTEKKYGLKATDIHKWIDGCFDHKKFKQFVETGFLGDYNPYAHRVHRHCKEALTECIEEFKSKYSEDIIKKIFESHLQDDYFGYIPIKSDFNDPAFHNKYHTK